jgi:hypothetical protein
MPPQKESPVMQILLTVVGLLLAGIMTWIASECVSTHDTLIRHTDSLVEITKTLEKIEARLDTVPTRAEVDNKIATLRTDVDSDNKATEKGDKGAELLRN